MKFTVNRLQMLDAARAVSKAIADNKNNRELSGILIEADAASGILSLTGSNMITQIQRRLKPECMETSGSAILKPMLADILRLLSEENVSFEQIGRAIHIIAGNSRFELPFLEAKTYPKIHLPFPEDTIRMQGIHSLVQRTVFAAGKNTEDLQQAALQHIKLTFADGNTRAEATDGNKAAVSDSPHCADGDMTLILHESALKTLCSVVKPSEELFVGIVGRFAVFMKEDMILTSKLYAGQYTESSKFLEYLKPIYKATVDGKAFRETVKNASLLISGTDKPCINLCIQSDQIVLCVVTANDRSQCFVNAMHTVPTPADGFFYSPALLSDCLSHTSGPLTIQIDKLGRLDLASILPGHLSYSRLQQDAGYQKMKVSMETLMQNAENDADNGKHLAEAAELQKRMEQYRKCLVELYGSTPEILTENKIPESNIAFLDEIFKANDGVLNSLLKALNERTYTNEGVTMQIPTISFFAASNEIPNFNNPEEQSLRALYDRFDFKVHTQYVEDKANRMRILAGKQTAKQFQSTQTYLTLSELAQMQVEVQHVAVPEGINELADNILCELRRKNLFVSDRTYFNFTPVVQAEAWLNGRDTVEPTDMQALVNYLWDKPEDKEIIHEVIRRLTENPLGNKLDELLARCYEQKKAFEDAADKNQALLTLRNELLAIYDEAESLRASLSENDAARSAIDGMLEKLETVSREAHKQTRFTYLPMSELKAYQRLGA